MALLSFAAIEPKKPERLLQAAFYGLKSQNDYLTASINRFKDTSRQPQVRWVVDEVANKDLKPNSGQWVNLRDVDEKADISETILRAFTSEDVEKVAWVREDYDSKGRPRPRYEEINVLECDPDEGRLRLAALPDDEILTIRPNTYQLEKQRDALRSLQNEPHPDHRGLLRLLEREPDWPELSYVRDPDWMVLTDPDRPGANEQRDFVRKALSTPDFAFLDGPPGSGKTTVICEIVLQMARAGKRVLLCGSTHVAVDNVLERLMHEKSQYRDLIVPIRVGNDKNLSDEAKKWTLQRLKDQERKRLLKFLSEKEPRSTGQQALFDALRSKDKEHVVERLLLDGANLVCGSSIGILQHPDIKGKGYGAPSFDMLIVDEASKTTFLEFLVPALLAKRWVLVGDPRQLSPYVDDTSLCANLETIVKDEIQRNACVDVFLTATGKRGAAAVVADEKGIATYKAQAEKKGACLRAPGAPDAPLADIVIGTAEELEARPQSIRIDLETLRSPKGAAPTLERRWLANGGNEPANWAEELAWRYVTRFGLRRPGTAGDDDKLKRECEDLLPADAGDKTLDDIDLVRRIALPSVLESLQFGFERAKTQKYGNALSDGLPQGAFDERYVLLKYQHRMHPEIASFSAEHFYDGAALQSPSELAARPHWTFRTDEPRAVWHDVRGGFNGRKNANEKEVDEVIRELRAFRDWADRNPPPDGGDWEAAALAFYRGQEKAVRMAVRRLGKKNSRSRRIRIGEHCVVDVCTVDRFQGQEADLVILSFAKGYATSFLRSPNRLNVALTRARHRRVIIGDRKGLERAKGELGALAKHEKWGRQVKGKRT